MLVEVKGLRKKENLLRKAFVYIKIETGNREPDIDTLQKIADFFGVTLDYLTGRNDDPLF